MDKDILTEYADMKEEIKDLRRRIAENQKAISRLNNQTVIDSVSCGKKGKKSLGIAKVEGNPVRNISRKERLLNKQQQQLKKREKELLEAVLQVEEYIGTIQKSELRTIFRLYYIDDLPWWKVALRMNEKYPDRRTKYTEDNCRMKHNRFLEKVE